MLDKGFHFTYIIFTIAAENVSEVRFLVTMKSALCMISRITFWNLICSEQYFC
jgi:hypothetical protein